MRKTEITLRGNQRTELYVQRRPDAFELWLVATIEGRRLVLDHSLTHDDLEARLGYARQDDLHWFDAKASDVPTAKHPSAVEMEQAMARGSFADYQDQGLGHHFGAISLIPIDRKALNAAKKAIHGQWTDGVASLGFEPDHKLAFTCQHGQRHQLKYGTAADDLPPDWWNFSCWMLFVINNERKAGKKVAVLHVDEHELHLWNDDSEERNLMARVFRRERG